MRRYRYSRKQIAKWIKERDGYTPSWYPIDVILKRLTEKAYKKLNIDLPASSAFVTDDAYLWAKQVTDWINAHDKEKL